MVVFYVAFTSVSRAHDEPKTEVLARRVGNSSHMPKLYPGLGHTLGETSSVIQDNFQLTAQRPLKDLVGWLEIHATK